MISVVVMAHEKRRALAEELSKDLGDCQIVWDQFNNRWETGSRALLAFDPEAHWHVVVQDDALICADFLAGVELALSHAPDGPVSFYTGKVKPHGPKIAAAVLRANELGLRWLEMPGPLWGPAVAIPTKLIPRLVKEADRFNVPNYDLRIAQYFRGRGLKCHYSLPSLVDHRTGPKHPSLVPGRSSHPARTAHTFIGEKSPLEIDWATRPLPVDLHAAPTIKTTRSSSMNRIAKKRTYGYDRHGRRVLVAAAGKPIPKGFDIAAEAGPKSERVAPPDYSGLKQPALKALCDERGIAYPKGPVKNAALIELLEAADKA